MSKWRQSSRSAPRIAICLNRGNNISPVELKMDATIAKAIHYKRVIEFEYNGHLRVVEPHAYGLSMTNHEVIRGYQVQGTTDTGSVQEWHLFEVKQITKLKVTDRHFEGIRNGYQRGDKRLGIIYSEL